MVCDSRLQIKVRTYRRSMAKVIEIRTNILILQDEVINPCSLAKRECLIRMCLIPDIDRWTKTDGRRTIKTLFVSLPKLLGVYVVDLISGGANVNISVLVINQKRNI